MAGRGQGHSGCGETPRRTPPRCAPKAPWRLDRPPTREGHPGRRLGRLRAHRNGSPPRDDEGHVSERALRECRGRTERMGAICCLAMIMLFPRHARREQDREDAAADSRVPDTGSSAPRRWLGLPRPGQHQRDSGPTTCGWWGRFLRSRSGCSQGGSLASAAATGRLQSPVLVEAGPTSVTLPGRRPVPRPSTTNVMAPPFGRPATAQTRMTRTRHTELLCEPTTFALAPTSARDGRPGEGPRLLLAAGALLSYEPETPVEPLHEESAACGGALRRRSRLDHAEQSPLTTPSIPSCEESRMSY
jgi:hypothetical protein